MSLLFPLYLAGLLALALPYLLHRFSHHQPPEQAFPSTRFLESTRPPATSKKKLRHLALLALRVLFLAGLCLLFAEPLFRSDPDAKEAKVAHLFVLDNSFSMQAGDTWKNATAALTEAIDSTDNSDAVQVFAFASRLQALNELSTDTAGVSGDIASIEPGFESADYGELMRQLNKVASDIDMPVKATFITDAQRSNLPSQINTLLANRLEEFELVSVQAELPVNYYLQAEARTSDSVTARVSVRVAASDYAAKGTEDSEGNSGESTGSVPDAKTIEIVGRDRVVASRSVELQPGEIQTLQFDDIPLPATANPVFTVKFANTDFLPADDSVNIPVQGTNFIEFGLARTGDVEWAAPGVFLKTALETDGESRVETMDAAFALSPGKPHAIVITESINTVPNEVERFVLDGGNVLLVAGESEHSNNTAADSTANNRPSSVAGIDQAHPLALGDIDWLDVRFYSVGSFETKRDDRVLLSLDNGAPLLIERTIANTGRLLLLNDVLNGFDSDLPIQPAFVSLMHNVIEYFEASNSLPSSVVVGKALLLPQNSQIMAPDGEALLTLSQLGSGNSVRLQSPGVYDVLGANGARQIRAVLDSRESNLVALKADELEAWEKRHDVDETPAESAESAPLVTPLINNRDMRTIWQWLLPIVLLFLLIESIFANRLLWVRRDGF